MMDYIINITNEQHILLLLGAVYGIILSKFTKFIFKLKLNKVLSSILSNVVFSLSVLTIMFVMITYKGEIDLILVGLLVIAIVMVFNVLLLKHFIKFQRQSYSSEKEFLKNQLELFKKNNYFQLQTTSDLLFQIQTLKKDILTIENEIRLLKENAND